MPHPTKPISDPMKAALLECFQASIDLIPDDLRPQFILVGAAASIAHGSRLWMEDVDIAGSAEAITAFRAAIDRGGTRFHICPAETI
ncbi:hypothetical protein K432DRAFT_387338 [Lepidopterella palustris CBS 459.81]|uniref:Uncharacterized protein n=1 Tax=Lepidopterella palustris CBS 459.81 TaxID=1314670 RepID=A0A8E2DXU3_9PEZI|nr:hypothetical protein K432DRAFT_387338 [Lepidopterella palustris CBS 459.81]